MEKNDTYTCEMCGGTYQTGWSDAEAKAESDQLWGEMPDEDMAIICDDCFKRITSAPTTGLFYAPPPETSE